MKHISTSLLLSASALLAACSSTTPEPLDSRLEKLPNAQSFSAVTATERCQAMEGTQLGTGIIVDASPVEKNDELLGFFSRMLLKWSFPSFPETKSTTDFCRVTAKLNPVPGSEITTEVWLPQQWNQKIVANGGGGFNGGLAFAPLAMGKTMDKGYASIVTDAGHKMSNSAKFAYNNPEKVIDFGYRANTEATLFGKALVNSYYGKPAQYTYFQGGSNGGRDALMMALRAPDSFDGIIAGMPAAAWSRLAVTAGWNHHAVKGAPNLVNKLELLQSAVLNQCDELDGVKDELIQNPLDCNFDPATLQCHSEDNTNCLTKEEVIAASKIYQGPILSDGTRIYPGVSPGGETQSNWGNWIASDEALHSHLGAEFFRWMVYGDKQWSMDNFDLQRDFIEAKKRVGDILDSDSPNINPFIDNGGKLILYHGWNDAGIPAESTLNYFNSLSETLGDARDKSVRLYMVPGMDHSPGGPSPSTFDMLSELEQWVENDVSPERVIATQYNPPSMFRVPENAEIVRTRPLCPWPQVARYTGEGSVNDAQSFDCVMTK